MATPPEAEGPSPPTFFIDRCLGKGDVPDALERVGAIVERHDDHFSPDYPDERWLREVAAKGWVVLTKDQRIKRRPAEKDALRTSRSAAFILTAGDLTGAEAAHAFVTALPRIGRLLVSHVRPLIATVTAKGSVAVLEGQRRGGVRRGE